jgi:predicted Zn-dependent peptidase
MKIIERIALSSNLKIILAPMTGVKTVTGVFACRAGGRYETKQNNGIAHFLEHMVFKGTKNRPTALDIAKEVEGRGGDWNAFTSDEMTCFFIRLPCRYIQIICDVLSDMIFNSLFKPEEIEKEKGTIIQELRMGRDIPMKYVLSWLWPALLYGDQPIGRRLIGTEESIKNIRRENFIEFMDGLYTDENCVFCLAGRLDTDEAFLMADKYFCGTAEGRPSILKPAVIESQNEPALLLESRDIEQSHLILGVRAFDYHHSKKEALWVLDVILGGNMSSRLFSEIREKRGLAYYVGTFYESQSDVGHFACRAGISREKTLEAITVIIDEYKKICDEKVAEEELQRAKDYLIGSSQMEIESSVNVVQCLAGQWVMEGKAEPFSVSEKKIKAVTAEDVQFVAQEIFVNKGLNLAIVGPHEGMEEEFLKILKF